MHKILSIAGSFFQKCYHSIDSADKSVLGGKKSKLILFILSLVFFGSVIFVFNYKTPMQWDDFKLAFIWPDYITVEESGQITNPTERVTSFSDIIISQYNHYYTWGGRTVVHIIAQFLLFIPPISADILNTLMYLMYVILIYYHIIGKGKHDMLLFIGVNFLVWFLQPVFGETILWLTGSANYLWGTCFILLFLLPFRLFENTEKGKYSITKSIAIIPLGFVAGWTNENTAAATIFLTAIFLLYYYYQKWRMPAWAIAGIVSIIAGYLIMISAPGNFVRADLRTGGISTDLFSFSYRFLTSTQLFVQYLGIANFIAFILLMLFRQYSANEVFRKRITFLSLLYFTGGLVAVYVMLFSPFFPPRAWFGAVTFNIISFGIVFYNLNFSVDFLRKIRQAAFFLGIFLFGFTLYEGYRDINNINNMWKERKVLIAKQKETGEPAVFHFTWARTKFALSDPPFIRHVVKLYYEVDIDLKE